MNMEGNCNIFCINNVDLLLPEEGDLNKICRPPHIWRIHEVLPEKTSPSISKHLHPLLIMIKFLKKKRNFHDVSAKRLNFSSE